jgi:hypothetical protein
MSVEARGRPDIHDYPSGLSTSVQYFIYHTLCQRQISFINVPGSTNPLFFWIIRIPLISKALSRSGLLSEAGFIRQHYMTMLVLQC